MARPWALLLMIGILMPGRTLPSALAQAPPEGPVTYRGPVAFDDPDDPRFSLRWTLGATQPSRLSMKLPPRLSLDRRVVYELDTRRVLFTYRAGQQEILPPLAVSPEEFGAIAFRKELREAWISGTDNSLAEARARGGTPEGLINLSLPGTIPFTEKLFGEGAPNLRVRGSEQITISGSSSWVVGQVTGEQGGNSLFPKLDMRQRLNVNLEGTIGSKLSVSMAQNSDALTPLENSVKIRYRGEEDEVVRSVELGNTSLSLPSTQFVSYSARQEGLFGVKTEAQVGPVDFTAIASREQGQAGQSSYTGGAQTRKIRVPEWNYVVGKYFFLIDPEGGTPPPETIEEVRLYLDDKSAINNVELGAQSGRIFLDPAAGTPDTPATGQFHKLQEEEDYQLLNDRNFSLPVIVLNTPLSPFHTLAVAYRYRTGDVTGVVGDFELAPGDTILDLKMLRPSEEDWKTNDLTQSPWAPVRRLEMRNVYSLQVRDIEPGSLSLDIVRDVAGTDGNNPITLLSEEQGKQTRLLQVLGLDQKNNANSASRIPDGKVDPEFIDYDNGLLFFPDLRPFDPSLVDIEGSPWREPSWPRAGGDRADTLGYTKDESGNAIPSRADIRNREIVPEVYDLLYRELSRTSSDHHLYTIEAEVRASVSNVINLNAIGGILEGSETVRLNGTELRRGEDYTIVYETGQITLKNPDATAPGADLVITYSQDALFARGSQSLFGATLASRQDQTSKLSLSTTWLHQSKGVPDRRPRLRGEPTRTTVGDMAGRLRLEPWALTDLVDAIPLVRANQPSRLELNGAIGLSFPNPNTKGEVFIDDMEGAESTVPAGINRVNWVYSSVPVRGYDYSLAPPPPPPPPTPLPPPPNERRPDDPVRGITAPLGTPMEFTPRAVDRGQLLWYSPNTVTVGDLTPREDSQLERNDPVSVLEVVYVPQAGVDPIQAWGGLTTPLGNADVSRSQYLEIWINDFVPHELADRRRGELLIDVGTLSEDAAWDPLTPPREPNGVLDVEDKNQNGGQVEFDEDVGLDGVRSPQESARPPGSVAFTPYDAIRDPAADDRIPEVNEGAPELTLTQRIQKYAGINGTEDNQRIDGEDLDGDFELDVVNDYREYRIDLAAPAVIDNRRDYPGRAQKPSSGWRLYRIPLNAQHLDVGAVNLSLTKHMRIWFRGVAPGDTLNFQIASIEIVGNRWELADTTRAAANEFVNVGVVNNKENPEYTEPFEVRRIDNVKEREQSISIDFENLQPGSDARAYRRLQDTYDYTLYQSLSYYVNPRFSQIPLDTLQFYVRIGSDAATDTLSYYEISTLITENDPRRRGDGWLDFNIDVDEVTRLKVLTPPPDGPREIGGGLFATVVGNPSLSRVRRLAVGVRNISGRTVPEGSVWFNELRMGNVRRDMGWASRASANLVLSDLATLQASIDLQNADFLRLGQSRGSGMENVRYDLRGQIGLHKFMEPLRILAPLSGRVSQSTQTPKFVPNNDVLYDGPRTGAAITKIVDRGADLALSRDARGLGSPVLRYTLDAVRVSGSYGETFRTDVTRADSTRRWSGNASYNLSLGQIRPVRPLGLMSFWLWPRSVSVGLAGARVESRVWTPVVGLDTLETGSQILTTDTVTKTGNLGLGTTFQPITGLSYTFNSERDLIDEHYGPDSSVVRRDNEPLTVLGMDLGREVQQNHSLAFNYTPPVLGRTLSPRFTWTGSSTQNLRPNLTLEDYENAVFDINNTDNASLSMSLPLGRLIDGLVGTPRPARGGSPARPSKGRGAEADTARTPPASGDPAARKFFTQVIRLKDIQATGSLGHRSAYSRIYGDPPWIYRLGFTRQIGVGEDVFVEPRASFNQSIGDNSTLRAATSMTLLGQVGLDVSFQTRKDRAETNGRLGRVTNETTWPDMRFDWGDLQRKVPFFQKLFSDFRAVNTSFSRVTREAGSFENPKEEITVSNNWRPLVSVQGTLGGWRTTLNANLSSTNTETQRQGSAGTTSRRANNSYQLQLNKKFTGVAGKTSSRDIDLKVDLSYSINTSETRSTYSDRVQEDRRTQIRLNTSAGLRLTKALSGTFGLELGQESRPTTNWTRRSVRLFFTTGFNF